MNIKRNFVTPFITLLFLVIAISGTFMFFHILDGYTEVLHELLGILFLIFSVLHVVLNWKSLKSHFKKRMFATASIVITLLSILIITIGKGHNDYQRTIVKKLAEAEINNTLEILEVDSLEAVRILNENDVVIGNSKTIEEIAFKNNLPSKDILELITE